MSTRRTVSLRFRSRARLIAATVVLQALVVGVVSYAAIRGIQYYHEQEQRGSFTTENTKTLHEVATELRERQVVVPADKLATEPPEDEQAWFANALGVLRQQPLQPDTTMVAFLVDQRQVTTKQNATSVFHKVDQAKVATTPQSRIPDETWRKMLAQMLPRDVALHTVTNVRPFAASLQQGEHLQVAQWFPCWSQATPLVESDGDATVDSAWLVVAIVSNSDLASTSSAKLNHKLLWWFLSVGVLVIFVSILGTMWFARLYDTKIHQMNDDLERAAQDSSRRALQIRNGMIFGLAKLADYRDTDTGQHLERISQYCAMLAHELMDDFPEINQAWIEKLRVASSMHDIGKVGIPDYILLKPGALTATERKIMENHPIIGADTLIAIRRRSGDDELLNIAIQVTLSHHERFDGKGYPFGISRDQIPLAARIVSLADMYDALTSKRVYKPAMSHEDAKRIIREGSGTQFDPKIVNAFNRIQRKFDETRRDMAHDDVAIPHAKTPPVNAVPGPDEQPAHVELEKPETKPDTGRDRRAA